MSAGRIFQVVIVMGALWIWGSPGMSRAAENAVRRLDQIETHLSEEAQKLEAAQLREKDLLAELSMLQEKVRSGEAALDRLNREQRALEQEIESRKEAIAGMEDAAAAIEAQLARRLNVFYKFAREGYLKTIFSSQGLRELLHLIKYLKVIVSRDGRELQWLVEESSAGRQKIAELEAGLQDALTRHRALEQQAAAMQEELGGRVLDLVKVHQEKDFYETAVRELEVAAKEMRDRLSMLKEEESPSKERAFSDFERAKGSLQPPLPGEIVSAKDFLSKNDLDQRKGVFIRGDEDTVKAVFPGRIDFSGRLKGYGDMIIMNHGRRFYTVMGQLAERRRKTGEWVEAGEVLGSVKGGGPLYFEIRTGTENLDPREWFGLP
ncbi:hypothetical protein TRIP_B50055 [uncultured Desulfatiglans sp.]|uniref:M23ase beta-sheet core domain-containing protein n=1 Tax=Uncultured Desulfatiglans sp. TaxID=1748965 RepID=A0A653AFY6_UNCDX|nr:hypothetical protein TRIP_B50055 [uncultured Desulfatiglans sp.]